MSRLLRSSYIMEDPRESSRLESKVDSDAWVKRYIKPYLFPGTEVLSVGCGPASILRALSTSPSVMSATGLDVSHLRLHQALNKDRHNMKVRLCCGDARQMQFA